MVLEVPSMGQGYDWEGLFRTLNSRVPVRVTCADGYPIDLQSINFCAFTYREKRRRRIIL